jgi:tripartite-type tricarboxylate transporter receptor subunit TctC
MGKAAGMSFTCAGSTFRISTIALRQAVLVENRAGGSGVICADHLIKAVPDR